MDAFGRELNELLVNTYRSVNKIEECMLRDMSNAQLSIGELHTIECVGKQARDGRTVTEISQEMGITPPSVTAMVKRLEKKGYVTKTRSATDGRQVHIRLTELGRRADVAHRYFHRKMVNAVRQCVSEADAPILLQSVKGINEFFRQNLEKLEKGSTEEGGKYL